jgi:hypothetical protein
MQCFRSLGPVWAPCDPSAVVDWFSAHGRENDWHPDGHGLGSAVLGWLAPVDVVLAARLACDGVGTTTDHFSEVLRFNLRTKEQAKAIAELLEGRTWPPLKRYEPGGLIHMSERGPGFDAAQVAKALELRLPEIDPEGWEAWVQNHPIGADGLPPLLQSVMQAFAISPSAAGATVVMQAAPPNLLADTTARIIRQWASLDIDAAGQWLTEQGLTDALATAIAAFARVAVQLDPEAAFTWLEAVPDATRRERMILEQFESWCQLDPVAAASFLDSTQWPERRLQNIRRMAASRPPLGQ